MMMNRHVRAADLSSGSAVSRRHALGVVGALGLTAAAGACGESTPRSKSKAGDGDNALTKASLTPVDGAPALVLGRASDLPTVVNLWATWCAPCRKELPDFDAVAGATKDSVRFVGVNVGETAEAASAFAAELGIGFDQYVDEDAAVQAALGATTMPTTAFLSTDGSIVEMHSGVLSRADLEAVLASKFGV